MTGTSLGALAGRVAGRRPRKGSADAADIHSLPNPQRLLAEVEAGQYRGALLSDRVEIIGIESKNF